MSINESSLTRQESNKQSHPLASSDNQGAVAAGRCGDRTDDPGRTKSKGNFDWFLFQGLKSVFGNRIVASRLQTPAWVELTDVNIAAAAEAEGTPQALYYQSPKCLFSLILRPNVDMSNKFSRWGPIRAYLILKFINMDEKADSFSTSQSLVPSDRWGYYWEKCRIDRNNSVVRDEAHRPQQVSFSRDQNYHPYVEINGKFDLWFTVWFRAPVAPCFFELRLEDGSKHSLQVPFISSTGIGLEPRE